jgi:Ca2+-transporting ATPase
VGAILLTIILQLVIVYVPLLHPVLKTTSLDWNAMTAILLTTAASLICIELMKYLNKRRYYSKILM